MKYIAYLKTKKFLYILIILLSLIFCYKTVFKKEGNDFNVYYLSWELFIQGDGDKIYCDQGSLGTKISNCQLPENLEAVKYNRAGPFLYPHFFSFIFSPLGLLPYNMAKILWFYIQISSLLLVFCAISKIFKHVKWHYYLILFLIISRFVFINLDYGQTNILIMAGIFFTFYFYANNKNLYSSISLALVTTMKVSPVALLIYFIWKHDYKYFFRTILLIICFMLLPALFYGFKTNTNLIIEFLTQIRSFPLYVDTSNQSISAMLQRYLSSQSIKMFSEGGSLFVNFINIESKTIHGILYVIYSFIILSLYYFIKRIPLEITRRRLILLEGAFLSVAILLLTHLLWRAVLINMLFPTAYLLYLWYKNKLSKTIKIIFSIAIALYSLTTPFLIGLRNSDILSAYSCLTFATIMIFICLGLQIYKEHKTI